MTAESTESINILLGQPFEGRVMPQANDPNSKYSDFDGNPLILYPWSEEGLQQAVKIREALGQKGFIRSGLSSSGDDRRSAEGGLVVDLSYFSSIEAAKPSGIEESVQITVGAAARNSQLAKELIRVNAFLPIGDNPVKSVVSSLLSDRPGYFDRSMGHLRDYVDRLHAIAPQGDVVSISKDDPDFDSVMDGSFGGVIETISFSAVPAARKVVRLVRASSVYTHENFAAALDLIHHPDISDTMDVSIHTHHIAYGLIVISVTVTGRPDDDDKMNAVIDAIVDRWMRLRQQRDGSFARQTKRLIQRVEAETPAEIIRLILEGGIADNPYLDHNLICKHYNQVVSQDNFESSSFIDDLKHAFLVSGRRNPPKIFGSLRLSLTSEENLVINTDIFLPTEQTEVETRFLRFINQMLGEPLQSQSRTVEQRRFREVEVPEINLGILRSAVPQVHPLKALGFEGEIYAPGDIDYDAKRTQYASSSYPDRQKPGGSMYPYLIAYPKPNTEDIATAIKFARTFGQDKDKKKRIVARSGGHQYSGLSSGGNDTILLSMDNYRDDIEFKEEGDKINVTLGVGNQLTDIAEEFKKKGVTIPHGECPNVGIGGHVQTGGYGHILRSYGLALDRVSKFEIVLNDGTTETVERPPTRDESSLYWAVLGGGPGSFGIITKITFECIKDGDHENSWGSTDYLLYSKSLFRGAMEEIQRWTKQISEGSPDIPPDVDMSVTLYSPDILRNQTLLILEMVNGNKDNDDGIANLKYLKDARKRIRDKRRRRYLGITAWEYPWKNHSLSVLADKKVRRIMGKREYPEPYLKRLNCTKKPISDAFIGRFVDLIDKVEKSKTVKLVFQMLIGGGAYASPDPSPPLNSICHRDVTLCIVFDCFYIGTRGRTQAKRFQDEMQDLLEEFSGEQEIRMLWGSFGKTDLKDKKIRKLYYDDQTWSSLQKVKERVDEDDLFHTEFTVQLP